MNMLEQNTVAIPLELANRIAGYLSRQPFADVVEMMVALQQCGREDAQTKTAAQGAAVNGHGKGAGSVADSVSGNA